MRKLSARAVTSYLLAMLILGATAHAAEYYTKHAKSDQRRGESQAEHALVYVFRPASVGAAIKTWAFADDTLMMVSKPRAYSFAQVPAGKRLFPLLTMGQSLGSGLGALLVLGVAQRAAGPVLIALFTVSLFVIALVLRLARRRLRRWGPLELEEARLLHKLLDGPHYGDMFTARK